MAKKKAAPAAELAQSMPQPSEKDKQYETESHLRTLGEAADIMSDPDKLKRVHKLAGRRHKALKGMLQTAQSQGGPIKSLADLRKKANAKGNEPDEDDMG